MNGVTLAQCKYYLETLCDVQPSRRTGSAGNREATAFFARTLEEFGYDIDVTPFPCLDYLAGAVSLGTDDRLFEVFISPYSLGCDITAELVPVSNVDELENCHCLEKILLMKGDICTEPLMPKNFVFYNPDHHKRIYASLEKKQPAAIIAATTRNPAVTGALYPYPLIEDGDFDIPSVYCTGQVGEEIAACTGQDFRLRVDAWRIPSAASNVIALKNVSAKSKISVSAHIDAYAMPGALDDAGGTVVLMLLAGMLDRYEGDMGIEIIAFNGEDYYSAAGQMDYLKRYRADMPRNEVAINIDGVGFTNGRSAYSFYECPTRIQERAATAFASYDGLMQGDAWYQGDHMVFLQNGVPAIAFTSERIAEVTANITHTPNDTPDLVDCAKLVEIAKALYGLIAEWRSTKQGT